MSEEYEDELVTSHSDENPELTAYVKNRGGPIAAHSTEGSAVSELYKKDNDERYFHFRPSPGQTVIEEDTYIPDES